MRWDRLIAAILVTCGIAYASYSLVHYFFKLNVVSYPTYPEQQQMKVTQLHQQDDAQLTIVIPPSERPKKGEHFADLYIPRLNAVIPIIEGTDENELARGAGHFAGSVLPGEADNTVISGHRDTVFRSMGKLRDGDELHVRTKQGVFIYVIQKMWITTSDDRSVIVSRGQPILTLTTCYPFTYIGPAPKRYIIEAKLKERLA